MEKSESESIRLKANEIFLSVDNLAPILYKSKLNEAINMYEKAFKLSSIKEEKASLYKNIGACYKKMNIKESNEEIQKYNLINCFKYYTNAFNIGKSKSENWFSLIENEMINAFRQFLSNKERKIDYSFYFMNNISNEMIKPKTIISISLARLLLNESIKMIEKKEFKNALKTILDSYQPLETAIFFNKKNKLIENENLIEEIEDLKDSIIRTECAARSLQKFIFAENLFEKTVFEDEFIVWDNIYDILDLYKESIQFNNGKDIELEGIISNRLGKIFYKIIKIQEKARSYFHNSINFGMALRPKIVDNEKWFKESEEFLKEIQNKIKEQEDILTSEERTKLSIEFKAEIDELNTKSQNIEDYLFFIFEKYRPQESKNLKEDLEELKNNLKKTVKIKSSENLEKSNENPATTTESYSKGMKKILLKTIKLFHGDKINAISDKKNKFLSEEIIRKLTSFFTTYKG